MPEDSDVNPFEEELKEDSYTGNLETNVTEAQIDAEHWYHDPEEWWRDSSNYQRQAMLVSAGITDLNLASFEYYDLSEDIQRQLAEDSIMYSPESKAKEEGTSDGAKKGWLTRKRGGSSAEEPSNVDHDWAGSVGYTKNKADQNRASDLMDKYYELVDKPMEDLPVDGSAMVEREAIHAKGERDFQEYLTTTGRDVGQDVKDILEDENYHSLNRMLDARMETKKNPYDDDSNIKSGIDYDDEVSDSQSDQDYYDGITQTTMETLQQSTVNGFPFFAYVGRPEEIYKDGKGGVVLYGMKKNPNSVRKVDIMYDEGMDTYSVRFVGNRGKVKGEYSDIYFDQLSDIIVGKKGLGVESKATEEFREEDHPRDGGKFTSKGGGSSGKHQDSHVADYDIKNEDERDRLNKQAKSIKDKGNSKRWEDKGFRVIKDNMGGIDVTKDDKSIWYSQSSEDNVDMFGDSDDWDDNAILDHLESGGAISKEANLGIPFEDHIKGEATEGRPLDDWLASSYNYDGITLEDTSQEWWDNNANPSEKARILNKTGSQVENTFDLPNYDSLSEQTKTYLSTRDNFSFESKANEDFSLKWRDDPMISSLYNQWRYDHTGTQQDFINYVIDETQGAYDEQTIKDYIVLGESKANEGYGWNGKWNDLDPNMKYQVADAYLKETSGNFFDLSEEEKNEYAMGYVREYNADMEYANAEKGEYNFKPDGFYESKATEVRHLSSKQKSLIKNWVNDNRDSLSVFVTQEDLPYELLQEIESNRDYETLYSDISRYASDVVNGSESKASEDTSDSSAFFTQNFNLVPTEGAGIAVCKHCGHNFDLEIYDSTELQYHLRLDHGIAESKASENFTFYEDASHGWLEVPKSLLKELGIADQISSYSYQSGDMAYLEEDADLSLFISKHGNVNTNNPQDGKHIRNYGNYVGESVTWTNASFNRKLDALESLGITQGDAVRLASVAYEDLSEDLKKDLELPYTEEDAETEQEIFAQNEEKEEDVDYNNIGESRTARTKYECEHCNCGFKSNESLSTHYNQIHAVAPAPIEGYENWKDVADDLYEKEQSKRKKGGEALDPMWFEKFAGRSGVKRIPVENFLGTIDMNPDQMSAWGNFERDASMYNWNYQTKKAISDGIVYYYNNAGESKASEDYREYEDLFWDQDTGEILSKDDWGDRFNFGLTYVGKGGDNAYPLKESKANESDDWECKDCGVKTSDPTHHQKDTGHNNIEQAPRFGGCPNCGSQVEAPHYMEDYVDCKNCGTYFKFLDAKSLESKANEDRVLNEDIPQNHCPNCGSYKTSYDTDEKMNVCDNCGNRFEYKSSESLQSTLNKGFDNAMVMDQDDMYRCRECGHMFDIWRIEHELHRDPEEVLNDHLQGHGLQLPEGSLESKATEYKSSEAYGQGYGIGTPAGDIIWKHFNAVHSMDQDDVFCNHCGKMMTEPVRKAGIAGDGIGGLAQQQVYFDHLKQHGITESYAKEDWLDEDDDAPAVSVEEAISILKEYPDGLTGLEWSKKVRERHGGGSASFRQAELQGLAYVIDSKTGERSAWGDKWVASESYAKEDSLVKIEDDNDDDTQVTVLDEWENETDPDVGGKTEDINESKATEFDYNKWIDGEDGKVLMPPEDIEELKKLEKQLDGENVCPECGDKTDDDKEFEDHLNAHRFEEEV